MTLRLAPPLPPPEPAAVPDDLDHEFFHSLVPVETEASEDETEATQRSALRTVLHLAGAGVVALGAAALCIYALIPTVPTTLTGASVPGELASADESQTAESDRTSAAARAAASAPAMTGAAITLPAAFAASPAPTPALAPAVVAAAASSPRASVRRTEPAAVGGEDPRVKAAFRALSRGDAQAAIAQARRVVDASPTRADAWLVLGSAYGLLHDTQSARLAFRACALRGKGPEAETCRALAR